MGNSNSRNDQGNVDPANTLDDFEPIDKPASPTFLSTFQKPFNPNDLTTSGVLVDIPEEDKQVVTGEKRRSKRTSSASAAATSTPASSDKKGHHHHHHHDAVPISQQSDAELLQESLTKDKQERLQKLQTDQKHRRNKAIEERRKSPPSSSAASVVQPNPFSRFLSVFSVEPQFPNHKRRYEPSESEMAATEEDDPKRPKLDPSGGGDHHNASLKSILLDWLDTHLPPGWPWMAAAAATSTAIVALLIVTRNTKQQQQRHQLLLPPPSAKVTTIW
eukprot:CAMPEP_0170268218 /NCGR_PEP_ID=MMETSP0116_2-20130129/34037_1 /TAXON_ID=400756 /ORGANISM="Durinskia baltica, Strain CSIRO CS-38" /LENGTH=274 /DNA_ID=CAMNT_0010519377 /DNA_START=107 /DNA_END=931 /DNA_ORIENTATION=-